MPFTIAAENEAVDAVAAAGTWISLHTADPGTSGASEVIGGTYARKQTVWAAAANSSSTGSSVTIDVPAGVTITHWGLWDLVAGTTFYFGGALPANESFGSNGTYSLTPTLSASD